VTGAGGSEAVWPAATMRAGGEEVAGTHGLAFSWMLRGPMMPPEFGNRVLRHHFAVRLHYL
jgi:hypothetical protein